MSEVRDGPEKPRAVIHRRILDVAESRPDASLTEIASEVNGATPDLVEQVLTEYGDPGEQAEEAEETMTENGQRAQTDSVENGQSDGSDGQPETDSTEQAQQAADDDSQDAADETEQSETDTDASSQPADESELTPRQRETVCAVHENPDASQGDIADLLDVSRATVSRRLNDIPGFDWADREAFTANLFDSTDLHPEENEVSTPAPDDTSADVGGTLADIERRLDSVEGHLDSSAESAAESAGATISPDLAHRVIHATMESDRISEDEELELIEALL